jgi:predicted transcriptional regulator
MTNREFFTNIINGNIDTATLDHAKAELTKLDERNEKRRNAVTPNDLANAEIEKQIVALLTEKGAMLSADIATDLGITSSKVNGVGLQMVNKGLLLSTKVKVKGKGERTQYSLPTPTAEVEVEG